MTLVWKLLRQHISVPQFMGFFLANLLGMLIVLLGFQFYRDVLPVFTAEDSFMNADYLILNKRIGAGGTLSGRMHTFSPEEQEAVGEKGFVAACGAFTPAEYKVNATMGIDGKSVLNSEISFESVPDEFVDVPLDKWRFDESRQEVPVILPRIYMTLYNFGFAQNRSLPKLSEGLVGLVDLHLFIQGNGLNDSYRGKVIGFSSRLSSILVPQAFMEWSNRRYAPGSHSEPSRLIVKVGNAAHENIEQYLDEQGYETEDDQLSAEKSTFFLRLLSTAVMVIGLLISALSFYILMLSIYLLVQKNSTKLQNLLLIGYSPGRVALPYRLLALLLNALVLVLALMAVWLLRGYYQGVIETLLPSLEPVSFLPTVLLGGVLLAGVSLCNYVAIGRKVGGLWRQGR